MNGDTINNLNFITASQFIKKSNLNSANGFRLLKDYGINVADFVECQSYSEVEKHSKKLGFPIVLKTLKNNLHHKTEVNGVFTDIKTTWVIEGVGHGHQKLKERELKSDPCMRHR